MTKTAMLFKYKKSINLTEDWYPKKEFSNIIKKEINLSFRTGLPLSMISIDLSKIKPSIPSTKDSHLNNITNFFIKYISKNMRDEDIKCFRNEGIIDILLINTAIDGALIITQKLHNSLDENYNDQHAYTNIIKCIKFNNYPLNRLANKNDNSSDNDSHDNSLKHDQNQNNLYISENNDLSESDMKLDINVFPNGLISVANNYSFKSFENIRKMIFLFSKRVVDIIFTLLTLLFFSPLMIIIAITIKLSSEGPVFFKQKRCGQFQTPFTFYKFRTMKTNSDDQVHREYVKDLIEGKNTQVNLGTEEKPFYKIKKDDRITKIGTLLRNTSLDELPQFLNVLKGEMSIVGPRPPLPYEVESYKNWHLQRVLSVKPGITGLWQVSGKNKTTFDEMVRLDLKYIKNRSAIMDMRIMFKTLPAMFNERTE